MNAQEANYFILIKSQVLGIDHFRECHLWHNTKHNPHSDKSFTSLKETTAKLGRKKMVGLNNINPFFSNSNDLEEDHVSFQKFTGT